MLKFFTQKPYLSVSGTKEELESFPRPEKSSRFFPDWYKKLSREADLKYEAGTVKRCVPFQEAMSAGFTIPLWADIVVLVYNVYDVYDTEGKFINTHADFHNKGMEEAVGMPTEDGREIGSYELKGIDWAVNVDPGLLVQGGDQPISTHTLKQVGDSYLSFLPHASIKKFNCPWIFELPKGYSLYFKNYANDMSSKLRIFEGIVDHDEYYNYTNIPFIWTGTEVGEFIIPKGTPIAQIIPFKRVSFGIEYKQRNTKRLLKANLKLSTLIIDAYRNLFWHKRKER